MLDSSVYEFLDHILPCTAKQKHDTLRLEYLSACKLMENAKYTMKVLQQIPNSMFEPLLKSVIYKCYLEYLNSDNLIYMNTFGFDLSKVNITFPDSLWILILNWPNEEFILRNQIPPLHPPVEQFQIRYTMDGYYSLLASQKQTIIQIEEMIKVFKIFCNRLIIFIQNAISKCKSENTQGFSCTLKRLDLSGLGLDNLFYSVNKYEILDLIHNSKCSTIGHKIDIFVDIELPISEFDIFRDILGKNLNPDLGISVYFKNVSVSGMSPNCPLPSDFSYVLALGRCEYVQLGDTEVNGVSLIENLYLDIPKLVGINLLHIESKNVNFLNAFEYLEYVSFHIISLSPSITTENDVITNTLCEMSKGLKYLNLTWRSLQCKHIECLAKSIHSDTLRQLNLSMNDIGNDSEAVGLIMLCQKLKNIKVLIVDDCSLNTLSSNAVSNLINAFKDCHKLEFLSMIDNLFNLEMVNIIIDGLSQKHSLRYLSLNLPVLGKRYYKDNLNDRNVKYMHNLCKTFHEKINKFRQLPIYISWELEMEEDNEDW